MNSWIMWGHKTPNSNVFMDIGTYKYARHHSGNNPLLVLEITENPNGKHHGWMGIHKTAPDMIWPSFAQLSMCFPYGIQAEINEGRGKAVRLDIQEACNLPEPLRPLGETVARMMFTHAYPYLRYNPELPNNVIDFFVDRYMKQLRNADLLDVACRAFYHEATNTFRDILQGEFYPGSQHLHMLNGKITCRICGATSPLRDADIFANQHITC